MSSSKRKSKEVSPPTSDGTNVEIIFSGERDKRRRDLSKNMISRPFATIKRMLQNPDAVE